MSLPTAPNKNLYNGGSEWQNDFADQPGWQQTFYRNYDAALGRFLAVDPMAEATESMTVYQYGNNNPIMMNNPMGNLANGGRIPIQDYQNGSDPGFFGKWHEGDPNWADAEQFFIQDRFGVYGGGTGQDVYIDRSGKVITRSPNKNLPDGTSRFYLADRTTVNGRPAASGDMKELSNEEALSLMIENANQGGGWGYTHAALGVSAVLACDDITGVGIIDDIAIPFIVVGAVAHDLYTNGIVSKMAREIDRIAEKAKGPQGFVYELVATRSGLYPNLNTGVPTFLNAGDAWKYGQTINGFGRYSQGDLASKGLQMIDIFHGNQMEIRIQEKIMIYSYYFMNGSRPAGNPIFR